MKIREWELPNGKRKEINVPILASHCPFCGVSVEQPKSDNVSDQRPGDRDATKNKSSGIAGFAASDG